MVRNIQMLEFGDASVPLTAGSGSYWAPLWQGLSVSCVIL